MVDEPSIDEVLDAVRRHAAILVAAGFESEKAIVQQAVDCTEDLGRSDLAPHVPGIVRALLEEHLRDEQQWVSPTDCERLDMAFETLARRGVVAAHNFGFSLSDGHAAMWEAITDAQRAGRQVLGYAFYHAQDADQVVETGDLYLAFGLAEDALRERAEYLDGPNRIRILKTRLSLLLSPSARARHTTRRDLRLQRWVSIGEAVADVMKDAGFTVDWDGSPYTRVRLSGLQWRRRRAPQAG